ncbi:MAG: hypothetical protein AB7K24_28565 [Gemmataceae bacterium]
MAYRLWPALLCCALFAPQASAGELYDGSPGAPWWEFDYRFPGGITYIHHKGQSVCSVGGLFTRRRVIVTERDGGSPVRTRFVYPSAFHTPNAMLDLKYGRGVVEVGIPDENGLLYVNHEAEPRRGPVHVLVTPVLEAGQTQVFKLRAAFRSGNDLLIEEATVSARPGQPHQVVFTGSHAVRVPLPDRTEQAPAPRTLPDSR